MAGSFNIKASIGFDFSGIETASAEIRAGAMRAAARMRVRAKLELRADVRAAGLGDRLANTWQDKVYPEGGKQSWHPTVLVYSKAPAIVAGHTGGNIIHAKNGVFLAIPTKDVPRLRAGRPLTVEETEERYGKSLILIAAGHGAGGHYGVANAGIAFLVLRQLKVRRASGRYRNASQKEIGRGAARDVVMFILVRQVTLRPRLKDYRQIERDLGPVWQRYLAEEVKASLELAA